MDTKWVFWKAMDTRPLGVVGCSALRAIELLMGVSNVNETLIVCILKLFGFLHRDCTYIYADEVGHASLAFLNLVQPHHTVNECRCSDWIAAWSHDLWCMSDLLRYMYVRICRAESTKSACFRLLAYSQRGVQTNKGFPMEGSKGSTVQSLTASSIQSRHSQMPFNTNSKLPKEGETMVCLEKHT